MSSTTECDAVHLYYRSGSSDKVYQASIEPSGDGFVVRYAYGRRGSTLTTGSRTPSPVSYPQARKVFDSLVRQKTAKGYTPSESGVRYQNTDHAESDTGVQPQLLNPIDEARAQDLIQNDAFWAQEKLDGRRVLIRRKMDQITGINRRGLTIDLPETIVTAALALPSQQYLIDGEALGDAFVAFDLLEQACIDYRSEPYSNRIRALGKLVPAGHQGAIRRIQTATTTAQKRALYDRLQTEKREGIVFKRTSAVFTPGRPASGGDQLKCKFYATASCRVAGSNGSKRSVKLQLVENNVWISVGNVTIPANHAIPSAGAIVEVRYLYAYPSGTLYQPVYLGERTDLTMTDCTLTQLKYEPVRDATQPE